MRESKGIKLTQKAVTKQNRACVPDSDEHYSSFDHWSVIIFMVIEKLGSVVSDEWQDDHFFENSFIIIMPHSRSFVISRVSSFGRP